MSWIRSTGCLAALFILSLNAWATSLDAQRAAFKKAYRAIEAGRPATASAELETLDDYALYPYLRYARLDRAIKHHLDRLPPRAVADFLADYPDLPVNAKLRYRWLRALAAEHDWTTFLDYYHGGNAAALVCARVSAGLVGPDPADRAPAKRKDMIERAIDLWLSAHDQPPECDAAFDWLDANDLLTDKLIRQRFNKALDAHHFNLASYLADKLDDAARERVARWRAMASRPADTLASESIGDDAAGRALLVYGIERLARRDAAAAMARWYVLRADYDFNDHDRAQVNREIALWEARQHLPNAYHDLDALPAAGDNLVKQWRIRTALWHGWWHTVLKDIGTLPRSRQRRDQWQYWRARALAQTDHQDEADAIFRRLAGHHGYYGFLAADRIDAPYALSPRPSKPNAERMRELDLLPHVVRARELFKVGLLDFADAEWKAAIKDMSTGNRCQAGLLADGWQWYSTAIRTLAAGGCWHDLKLRYPIAYRDQVHKRADELDLDPAWLYGLMRSESLFAANAVSYAGALGLMQLMPATGRSVAKRLGVSIDDNDKLLDPALNIRLGSAYLSHIGDRFGNNLCLTTAAYNAGPGNVSKWLPTTAGMAADVWVDNIPFGQTRHYVRRVMTQTALFARRLGDDSRRISARMATIQPLATGPATASRRAASSR